MFPVLVFMPPVCEPGFILTEGFPYKERLAVKLTVSEPTPEGLGVTERLFIVGGFGQLLTTQSGYASPQFDVPPSASVAWQVAAMPVPSGAVIVMSFVNVSPFEGAVMPALLRYVQERVAKQFPVVQVPAHPFTESVLAA